MDAPTPWTDTDEHRDHARTLHQLIANHDGPYVAAAWLIGISHRHHSPRTTHGADARAAAHAHLNR